MRTLILLAVMCSTSYAQHVHHHHTQLHPAHFRAAPVPRFFKDEQKAARLRAARLKRVESSKVTKNFVRDGIVPDIDDTYRIWTSSGGTTEVKAKLVSIRFSAAKEDKRSYFNTQLSQDSILHLQKKRDTKIIRVHIQDISDLDRTYVIGLCKGWRLARDLLGKGNIRW